MEESRSPGSCSSDRPLATGDGQDPFREVLSRRSFIDIVSGLGPDADLHLVGGVVRDILAGEAPGDIDLASKLRPEDARARLEARGLRVVDTGIEHGTVTIVVEGEHLELTTFRVPGARSGSAYSDSIEEDLAGRDFTINAIGYSINRKELLDPFGGRGDLQNGIVRAVGDAALRFSEDPLRILRMIRFGPAAGRSLDPATAEGARGAVAALRSVSVERIRDELEQILLGADAPAALRTMLQLGLIAELLPEMLPAVGCEQNDFHVHDVFEHTLEVVGRAPRERILRWSALFHDLGKPATLSIGEDGRRHFFLHEKISTELGKQIMERLKFSHDDERRISLLVALHMRPLTCGPQGARRLIRELGEEMERWLQFKEADKPPRGDEQEYLDGWSNFQRLLEAERSRGKGSVYGKLAVNGDDLIAIGIEPGPLLGRVLKTLEEAVIEDPELNDKQTLLAKAEELAAAR